MSDERTVSWRELLAETEALLRSSGAGSPGVDARRIVEQVCGLEGAEWVLGLDDPATTRGVAHLDAMVARCRAGEPLQYVLGRWGFRTLDLMVDRRVLIPRPETEQVAGLAIAEALRCQGGDGTRPVTVVDLGTGSGAIALAVAVEVPASGVWGVDRSTEALEVARANLAGVGRPGARVRLVEGDWFDALPGELAGQVDVVVANPPYVAASDDLPAVVDEWEPAGALVSGPTGMEDIEHIVRTSAAWLAAGGALVVELAPHQAVAALDLAVEAGLVDATVEPDLSGRLRALVARAPG
ncbi:MAG TPA: peptide chain release factor N(5)-glutamine methyltransferase [Acidimicrobiales bacterium]|nr:peptide chain release factor N(5)-glutamine methyltransferase [Acidimicrobiales bacterium]